MFTTSNYTTSLNTIDPFLFSRFDMFDSNDFNQTADNHSENQTQNQTQNQSKEQINPLTLNFGNNNDGANLASIGNTGNATNFFSMDEQYNDGTASQNFLMESRYNMDDALAPTLAAPGIGSTSSYSDAGANTAAGANTGATSYNAYAANTLQPATNQLNPLTENNTPINYSNLYSSSINVNLAGYPNTATTANSQQHQHHAQNQFQHPNSNSNQTAGSSTISSSIYSYNNTQPELGDSQTATSTAPAPPLQLLLYDSQSYNAQSLLAYQGLNNTSNNYTIGTIGTIGSLGSVGSVGSFGLGYNTNQQNPLSFPNNFHPLSTANSSATATSPLVSGYSYSPSGQSVYFDEKNSSNHTHGQQLSASSSTTFDQLSYNTMSPTTGTNATTQFAQYPQLHHLAHSSVSKSSPTTTPTTISHLPSRRNSRTYKRKDKQIQHRHILLLQQQQQQQQLQGHLNHLASPVATLFNFDSKNFFSSSSSSSSSSSGQNKRYRIVRGISSGGTSTRPPKESLTSESIFLPTTLLLHNAGIKDLCFPQWSESEREDRRRIIRIERTQNGPHLMVNFSIVGSANENPVTLPPVQPNVDVLEVSCLECEVQLGENGEDFEEEEDNTITQNEEMGFGNSGGNSFGSSTGSTHNSGYPSPRHYTKSDPQGHTYQYFITSVEVIEIVELLIGTEYRNAAEKRKERGRVRSNLVPFWLKRSIKSKVGDSSSSSSSLAIPENNSFSNSNNSNNSGNDSRTSSATSMSTGNTSRSSMSSSSAFGGSQNSSISSINQEYRSELARRIMKYEIRKPRGFDKEVRILRWDKLVPALKRALQSYYTEIPKSDSHLQF